ncbi:hypothetical protein [Leptospira stimsonii]|uniref:hypothetical protein n=1 Tax=Leptospira stimsonii TaxID=2202203 RepID=UPI001FEF881B|nr:hypothetical protein [Leptospira stimsonii]
MLLVFSHGIDPETLDASDFQILTKKGELLPISFVTVRSGRIRTQDDSFAWRIRKFSGEQTGRGSNYQRLKKPRRTKLSRTKDKRPFLGGRTFSKLCGTLRTWARLSVQRDGARDRLSRSKTVSVVRIFWFGGVRLTDGSGTRVMRTREVQNQMNKRKENGFGIPLTNCGHRR